jgi:predicted nuclease of predicted toxin-antitoxin system
MRLLLDQNLSWRLAEQLQDLFPGSAHVRGLGLDHASDDAVWE